MFPGPAAVRSRLTQVVLRQAGVIRVAIGLPLVAAVLWGLFSAPNRELRQPGALTAVVKIAFFGLAGLALWSLEHRILGIAFVVVVAADLLIIHTGNRNTDSPASGQNSAVQSD